jgi:hypothetical protein
MKEKKKRGRPKLYPEGTETITIRLPLGMADVVRSAMAAISLASQEPHIPDGIVLIEALKARLLSLANRPRISRKITWLDQMMSDHYPHLRDRS